jgi:hypothetical protein
MPDHRKPPHEQSSSRHDGAPMPSPSDSGGFSIESTTVRLKSMRLQRAEKEQREYEQLADSSASASASISTSTSTSISKPEPRSMWPASRPAERPAGRVKHDDRGVAVWDFAIATGEFAALSQTAAIKRLSIADLQVEDQPPSLALKPEKSGRDKGGGFDPYNQRGSGKRQGEAAQRAGVTGAPDRDRGNVVDQLLGKKK